MLNLTLYGGVGEIGGNKVLLDDGKTKIFFDFGMSFTRMAEYFYNYLGPRGVNGVGDYLEFGLLPKLKGLYSKESLNSAGLKYYRPTYDAVFISHSHIDHIGDIEFIDENIPIYCGATTKLILEAVEESTNNEFGEHKYKTFRTGRKITIGKITIEPIHVDHSVPGAYGFIIYTKHGNIVYTGDFRIHGSVPELTRDFLIKAKKVKPYVMITEGTKVSPEMKETDISEDEVYDKGSDIVSKTSKLVLATFYGKDIDRFYTIYHIAKENKRKFVISMKLAHLINKLKYDLKLKMPDVYKDKNILIYKRRKRTGEYEDKDYSKWEREYLKRSVDAEFIRKHQGEVILNLDFTNFAELIDIKPAKGSHFIHSMSEPFSEEDMEKEVMDNWIKHFELNFHQLHASGHATGKQIMNIIKEINPKVLFPIHTEYPELFRGACKRVILPQLNKKYEL